MEEMRQLHLNYNEFSRQSMDWCSKQSEDATSLVASYIEIVVGDVERVTELSQESLSAIRNLRNFINRKLDLNQKSVINELMGNLLALADEHEEIKQYFNPIIQALQFQDRLRQNLENIGKVLTTWENAREDLISGNTPNISDEEYGKSLLADTTMQQEREVIRQHISGLPKEQKSNDSYFFD